MKQKILITTPIYYVNAPPHLGHAYTSIMADIQKRFQILLGNEPFLLTGTDEHGEKILQTATKSNKSPKEFVDEMSKLFENLLPKLNVIHDKFIRTTDPIHIKTVQYALDYVYKKGDIEFKEYEGLYCYGCERFYTEKELKNGLCPDHLVQPALIKEKNYFFKMSKYQDWLIDYIKTHPEFIQPEGYRNEVLSFLKEPLEDLCISRPKERLPWGIPIPFDDRFVTYVWFDALLNYLSGIGYPNAGYEKLWENSIHIIAKDILKPHAIYWPTMLHALDLKPYKTLFVHGYWLIKDQKISKSLGNVVSPDYLLERFNLDAVRYCFSREMTFGLDASFYEDSWITRINADLANDLGNLLNRTVNMQLKYLGNKIQRPSTTSEAETILRDAIQKQIDKWINDMQIFQYAKAYQGVWEIINLSNKIIDRFAPWELAKKPEMKDELCSVLYTLLEGLRIIAIFIYPVMPFTAEKIYECLGIKDQKFSLSLLKSWGILNETNTLTLIPHLFPRIEKKEITMEKGNTNTQQTDKNQNTDVVEISIDEFKKIDLRIGEIIHAEKVPNADRLLKLTVKADRERTIVSGIAEYYKPEELIGKKIIVVTNLKPVKLKGILSEGMILAAKDENGLYLTGCHNENVLPGAKIS